MDILNDLYEQSRSRLKRASRAKVAIFALICAATLFIFYSAEENESFEYALLKAAPVAIGVFFLIDGFLQKLGLLSKNAKISAQSQRPAPNFPINSADIMRLEIERKKTLKETKKYSAISVLAAIVAAAGLTALKFKIEDSLALAFGLGAFIYSMSAAPKIKAYKQNFKDKIIRTLVNSRGLNYDPYGQTPLEDFLHVYNCRVDEYDSNDLISGQVEDVSVRLGDFKAVKIIKTDKGERRETLFEGAIFTADFHKNVDAYVSVCHKSSQNLAVYGERAYMDDARFNEYFKVYSSDQIAARYALTPVLMEKILTLHLSLDAPINILISQDKIYVAVETWRDNFEPDINASLLGSDGAVRYARELDGFLAIVSELNLNRKIWKMKDK
ncbi:MAG: DUF3137 domain-containing protein [Campylobacter sp.]